MGSNNCANVVAEPSKKCRLYEPKIKISSIGSFVTFSEIGEDFHSVSKFVYYESFANIRRNFIENFINCSGDYRLQSGL